MRPKQISSEMKRVGFGSTHGETEEIVFECCCGKGRIFEEHDNIVGHKHNDVTLECEDCSKKYKLDISKGIREWELVEK